MSEEAVAQAFGLEGQPEPENKTVEQIPGDSSEPEGIKEPTAIENEAMAMGWKPKEDFIANGGDESQWSPAHDYVKYGKLQRSLNDKLSKQEREFKSRLDNLNKYHEAQRQIEINNLKAQQRQAVRDADTDEYDRLQGQIDSIEESTTTPEPAPEEQSATPAEIADWEKANPWIYDVNDPRSAYAKAQFGQFTAQNPDADTSTAIAFVDRQIGKHFPKQNPRRESASVAETSSRKPAEPKKLSMNDLTMDEKIFWKEAGNSLFGGSQDAFLQAIQDSRAAQ